MGECKVVMRKSLIAFFIAVLTPLGIFFRLLRRDRLNLKWKRGKASYWQGRTSGEHPKEDYLDQL